MLASCASDRFITVYGTMIPPATLRAQPTYKLNAGSRFNGLPHPKPYQAQRTRETPAAVHTEAAAGVFRAPGANMGALCGRVASGCQNTPRQHQIGAHRVAADTLGDRHIRAHKKLARAQKVTRTETLLQRIHI